MKTWDCRCGSQIFFENTQCVNCGRVLGYEPLGDQMQALEMSYDDQLVALSGESYRSCANQQLYGICNWLIPSNSPDSYCLSCRLNVTIPALLEPSRREWWANMESAKRRLIYSLLRLGLPVTARSEDPRGLSFAFLEDRRSNPNVEEEYIPTGHADGLITVNLAEADSVQRELVRLALGESYRTLLGHFRHESGHYYFDQLLRGNEQLESFRALFGDETADYGEALKNYYAGGRRTQWSDQYLSAYATSHPLEDWAECWAHYLHMVDTLETATAYGLVSGTHPYLAVDQWIPEWNALTVALNGLNRSMGLQDAYPFVIGQGAIEKLRFVQGVIGSASC